MNKSQFRQFILRHSLTRELFFFFGRRKANLKKIDRALAKGQLTLSKEIAENTIVSLTSYGERIAELKYTLYSLVIQSVRPEKIIVNIAFEDEKYLNEKIKLFEQYGVEFYLCKDIRSYKKLIPTLQRFPDACVVTADDDMYYAKDWLKRLYEAHKKFPNDVCCHLVLKITHKSGKIDTYRKWIYNHKIYSTDKSIFLLGATGVLYPLDVFYKDICKEDLFMSLAPIADDIWFYFMVILNNKRIRQIKNPLTTPQFTNPYREYGITSGSTLMQQNVGENKNDIQFKNVLEHYGISEQQFIDYIENKGQLL